MVNSKLIYHNPDWVQKQHSEVWKLDKFYLHYPVLQRWKLKTKEQHFKAARVQKGNKYVCRWCVKRSCNAKLNTLEDFFNHLNEISNKNSRYALQSIDQYNSRRGWTLNSTDGNLINTNLNTQKQFNEQIVSPLFIEPNKIEKKSENTVNVLKAPKELLNTINLPLLTPNFQPSNTIINNNSINFTLLTPPNSQETSTNFNNSINNNLNDTINKINGTINSINRSNAVNPINLPYLTPFSYDTFNLNGNRMSLSSNSDFSTEAISLKRKRQTSKNLLINSTITNEHQKQEIKSNLLKNLQDCSNPLINSSISTRSKTLKSNPKKIKLSTDLDTEKYEPRTVTYLNQISLLIDNEQLDKQKLNKVDEHKSDFQRPGSDFNEILNLRKVTPEEKLIWSKKNQLDLASSQLNNDLTKSLPSKLNNLSTTQLDNQVKMNLTRSQSNQFNNPSKPQPSHFNNPSKSNQLNNLSKSQSNYLNSSTKSQLDNQLNINLTRPQLNQINTESTVSNQLDIESFRSLLNNQLNNESNNSISEESDVELDILKLKDKSNIVLTKSQENLFDSMILSLFFEPKKIELNEIEEDGNIVVNYSEELLNNDRNNKKMRLRQVFENFVLNLRGGSKVKKVEIKVTKDI